MAGERRRGEFGKFCRPRLDSGWLAADGPEAATNGTNGSKSTCNRQDHLERFLGKLAEVESINKIVRQSGPGSLTRTVPREGGKVQPN